MYTYVFVTTTYINNYELMSKVPFIQLPTHARVTSWSSVVGGVPTPIISVRSAALNSVSRKDQTPCHKHSTGDWQLSHKQDRAEIAFEPIFAPSGIRTRIIETRDAGHTTHCTTEEPTLYSRLQNKYYPTHVVCNTHVLFTNVFHSCLLLCIFAFCVFAFRVLRPALLCPGIKAKERTLEPTSPPRLRATWDGFITIIMPGDMVFNGRST